ncbi:carbohydrate kinase family protein [bacterium]|nr:carbohydrate kinase family protein [bacterium]
MAIDLARQGVSVDVAGCVGADASAAVVLQELEDAGVGCGRVARVPDQATSKTVILLVEGQDRRYLHMFGANAAFTVEHIPRDWVADLKVFYLGGLFLLPALRPEALLDLLAFCRAHSVVTVVDVVIPQDAADCRQALTPLLPFIDYFLPNNDEARALTGQERQEDQARDLLADGVGTVIVTRGANGVLAAWGDRMWKTKTFAMDVVDPSGSGDAFDSGVVTGILRGWDLPTTLAYASALGASAVRAVGTTAGVFTQREAQAFLATRQLALEDVRG